MIDASDSQNIKTVGETNLSDSALKHLVEVQNRLLVQFVDFDDGRWYCFYRTLRGLAGREQGNHGQHMHFISSAFGVNRDVLIENFKRGVCPGNGFHVRLASYHEEDVRESSADTAEDNR